MQDARARSIAKLRAQIQAIEEGSDAHQQSADHRRQLPDGAVTAKQPDRKLDNDSKEFRQRPTSRRGRSFGVSDSECSKLQTESTIPLDTARDQADSAFAKIQRLLCVREHASALLLQRLLANGFDEHIATEAVQRAIDCGLVSDERYADVLVRSRLSQGKGLRGIAYELEQAEIDPYSVPAYQEALLRDNGPDELDRALTVLKAKPPKAKRVREAAYRKLMQKGYDSSVAASAARIFTEELGCTALEIL